jgi:hypothetical protein
VHLGQPRFLLWALLLSIAVVALALFAEVTRRRSSLKSLAGPPPAGAFRIARLKHAGDWDAAPQAIPRLMDALRKSPFGLDVVLSERSLVASDPNLVYYPVIYLHGRGAFSLPDEDLDALRRQLDPGGGLLFADAACGSPAFDAAFRRFAAQLFPNHPLVPISTDDKFYTEGVGFDLSQCQYTKAAGGIKDYPQLEGVKVNGQWAVIYSKFGIGCVLDRDHDGSCKGYIREDAVRIGGTAGPAHTNSLIR